MVLVTDCLWNDQCVVKVAVYCDARPTAIVFGSYVVRSREVSIGLLLLSSVCEAFLGGGELCHCSAHGQSSKCLIAVFRMSF